MLNSNNRVLIVAATLNAMAAVAHVGCVVFGASWYRFLGAGEGIARMAEASHRYPTFMALSIATLLFIWSAYA